MLRRSRFYFQSASLDANALGFTGGADSNSLLLAFTKQYRHNVTDAFIPAKAMLRQCKYTSALHGQLTDLAGRARVEKFVPADCIDPNTQEIIASRLIVATAFDDRRQNQSKQLEKALHASSLSSGNNSSGGKTGSVLQTKQERNRELLSHTRRLAVEHFNWSYYWRSLAFDSQDEAAEKFCTILAEHDQSFFNNSSSIEESSSSAVDPKKKEEGEAAKKLEKLEESIKKHLKLYATEGGAVSQGGSWTWLVWNPFTKTSFSSTNRYGLEKSGGVTTTTTTTSTAVPAEEKSSSVNKTSPEEGEGKSTEKKAETSTKSGEEASKENTATTTTTTTTPISYSVPVAGRLEVINTPFDVCPLELGLFPILCVNMTERATLASPEEWSTVPLGDTIFADNQIPAWSRAARNPTAIKARAADVRKPGYQAFEPAEKQRERFADGVVDHLNWTNAVRQLEKALEWNSSKQRQDQMLNHAMDVRKKAELKAQNILDRKVGGGTAGSGETSATEQQQQEQETSTTSASTSTENVVIEQEESTTNTTTSSQQEEQIEQQEETQASSSSSEQSSSSLSPDEQEEANITPQVTEDGSLVFSMADGRVKYKYPDGSSTIQYPDGAVEWWHKPEDVAANHVKFTRQLVGEFVGGFEYHYTNGTFTRIGSQGEALGSFNEADGSRIA